MQKFEKNSVAKRLKQWNSHQCSTNSTSDVTPLKVVNFHTFTWRPGSSSWPGSPHVTPHLGLADIFTHAVDPAAAPWSGEQERVTETERFTSRRRDDAPVTMVTTSSQHHKVFPSLSASYPPGHCYNKPLASKRHVVMNCGVANKRGNVRIKRNIATFRVTIFFVENQLILYTPSVIYPACAILYCHLWPAWLYHIFPHHVIFGKNMLNKKFFPWFSPQFLSETYPILRRSQRGIIINVHKSSCKVPVIHVR